MSNLKPENAKFENNHHTNSDPLEVLRTGDGGGEVWERIVSRLERPESQVLPWNLRLLERLQISGTPLEAALRFPGAGVLLAFLAALALLCGTWLEGELSPLILALAPLCASLAGALSFRLELDPAAELARASTSARALFFARQTVVYGAMLLCLLPFAFWLPQGLWSVWLLPTLFLNAAALAVSLRWGASVGSAVGLALWLWLVQVRILQADGLPSQPQSFHFPDFPPNLWQALLTVACLLWVFYKSEDLFISRTFISYTYYSNPAQPPQHRSNP